MISIRNKQIVSSLIAFLLSLGIAGANANQSPEDSAKEKRDCVPLKLSTTIKARSELVWSSIHEARTQYPGLKSGRVISEDERSSIFEQKFVVPLLGEATCTFSSSDSPPTKMEYKLMNSNIFTAMDGSWTLAPGPDTHSTRIELSCFVAGKRLLPKFLLKLTLGRKLGKQLDFVKTIAERKELQVEAAEEQGNGEKQ